LQQQQLFGRPLTHTHTVAPAQTHTHRTGCNAHCTRYKQTIMFAATTFDVPLSSWISVAQSV